MHSKQPLARDLPLVWEGLKRTVWELTYGQVVSGLLEQQ